MKKLCVVVFTILIGCNTEPNQIESTTEVNETETATVDKDAVKASIDDLRQAYMEAAKTKDMEALMKLADQNSVMVMPAAESWLTMIGQSQSPIPYDSIQINPVEVVVIDNEWAWEMGRSQVYYTPEGEADVIQLEDTYLMIFRNQGDGWKLYREVASAGAPPQQQEMIME